MRTADPIGLAKALLWEEAKGKLRAIIAAEGTAQSGSIAKDEDGRFPFEKISDTIESFIADFESEGLHE